MARVLALVLALASVAQGQDTLTPETSEPATTENPQLQTPEPATTVEFTTPLPLSTVTFTTPELVTPEPPTTPEIFTPETSEPATTENPQLPTGEKTSTENPQLQTPEPATTENPQLPTGETTSTENPQLQTPEATTTEEAAAETPAPTPAPTTPAPTQAPTQAPTPAPTQAPAPPPAPTQAPTSAPATGGSEESMPPSGMGGAPLGGKVESMPPSVQAAEEEAMQRLKESAQQAKHNCLSEDFTTWEDSWSADKQKWCCAHKGLGCPSQGQGGVEKVEVLFDAKPLHKEAPAPVALNSGLLLLGAGFVAALALLVSFTARRGLFGVYVGSLFGSSSRSIHQLLGNMSPDGLLAELELGEALERGDGLE